MKYLANGRWALIVAGILAFCASQAQAGLFSFGTESTQTEATAAAAPAPQPEASPTKSSRHTRHRRHRVDRAAKSKKIEQTSAADKSVGDTGEAKKSEADAKPDVNASDRRSVPPAVANANAQLLSSAPAAPATASAPDTPTANDPAATPDVSAEAAAPVPPEAQIVSSDELNDLDKAAVVEKPAPKVYRPASSSVQSASAPSEDVWGQTSLIGKIFIAFGSMLTLASAARMFIA